MRSSSSVGARHILLAIKCCAQVNGEKVLEGEANEGGKKATTTQGRNHIGNTQVATRQQTRHGSIVTLRRKVMSSETGSSTCDETNGLASGAMSARMVHVTLRAISEYSGLHGNTEERGKSVSFPEGKKSNQKGILNAK